MAGEILHMTLEEWRAAALAAGGGDFRNTPFRCPLCRHVATPADFIAAGAEGERAAQECIGRVVGAKGGLKKANGKAKSDAESRTQPCDWVAFGLFGVLNDGIEVTFPDGKTHWTFLFAEGGAAAGGESGVAGQTAG